MASRLPTLILAFLLFLAAGAPAQAQQKAAEKTGALMTGRTLSLLCVSDKTDDLFACQNYIAGIIDYHHLIKSLGTAPSVDFCLPAGLSMDQVRRMVTSYLQRHSEHQDFIAAPGVAMALYSTYPCKKRR